MILDDSIPTLAEKNDVVSLSARVVELESRFRALTDGLDVGVVIHGPRTEILFANPRAEELLGATVDQLKGKTSFDPRWRALRDSGADFPPAERPTAVAFRTQMPQRAVVVGVFRPETNDRVWLLVSAVPQLDSNGEIRQVVATFADITAQKEAEARIRAQSEEILSLSVPFIPIAQGVALMPVTGTIDEARARRILDVALVGASAEGARVMILDMTGVPEITQDAVPGLTRVADACKLVGAEVLITGLRGEPARTLAQNEADLSGIKTLTRLQAAVAAVNSKRR